jgi:Holliday junction resolvasome RuvABC endonuclease subunit
MNHPSHVLGIHLSARGFGWVICESPTSLLDWGTVDIRNDQTTKALARLKQLMDKYKPESLALEAFDDKNSRRRPRIRGLCRAVVKLANRRGIVVRVFARADIQKTFGHKTRQEIARAVAERLECLCPRLPQPRKIWVGEHPGMALFAAAACSLAEYARR